MNAREERFVQAFASTVATVLLYGWLPGAATRNLYGVMAALLGSLLICGVLMCLATICGSERRACGGQSFILPRRLVSAACSHLASALFGFMNLTLGVQLDTASGRFLVAMWFGTCVGCVVSTWYVLLSIKAIADWRLMSQDNEE